ncbi:hypothetical protein ONE63_009837 [Megalurothrips usitatus]|uniref:Uncharacterized protein n=1 Tax=Megalurothrips usitatus TaxID=439358 RepID=A0AAV7XMG6_9NEOP|nr:hypothetical protein ONE63_009837 [Megalurothrips usitatus]
MVPNPSDIMGRTMDPTAMDLTVDPTMDLTDMVMDLTTDRTDMDLIMDPTMGPMVMDLTVMVMDLMVLVMDLTTDRMDMDLTMDPTTDLMDTVVLTDMGITGITMDRTVMVMGLIMAPIAMVTTGPTMTIHKVSSTTRNYILHALEQSERSPQRIHGH